MLLESDALDFLVGDAGDDESGPLLASDSPGGRFRVVFEDDGTTGYFYALDASLEENPIADALHIYNVDLVTDRHLPSRASIARDADGRVAALLINGYAHAVFDFQQRRGWCRTGFPPPSENGPRAQESHAWDETVDAHLRP